MLETFCQEDILSNLEELKNNLIYIFCRPYKEDYYYYSINSIDNYRIINKYQLKGIINSLSKSNIVLTEFLFNKYRSFIYIKDTDTVQELNPLEEEDIEELLAKIQIKDIFIKESKNIDDKNKYEKLFDQLKSKLKLKAKDNRRIKMK